MEMRRWTWLTELIKKHRWTRGVEVGVQKGKTLFYVLDHCPALNMVGVDLWGFQPEKGPDFEYNHPPYSHDDNFNFVKKQSIKYGNRLQLMRMLSVDAAKHLNDGSVDFVFIDGDHTKEGVVQDIVAWLPKVKKGGWLCGHDANQNGIKSALNEMLPGWTYHGQECDWCWSWMNE